MNAEKNGMILFITNYSRYFRFFSQNKIPMRCGTLSKQKKWTFRNNFWQFFFFDLIYLFDVKCRDPGQKSMN